MEEAGLGPADINMGITGVILIIIGLVVFAASFLLPGKQTSKEEEGLTKAWEEKVKRFFLLQVKAAKDDLEEKTDEVMSSSAEKAERCMERITNEKIMAVQEYSDTVLEQIHKNHEEAVFLYDMLNSKHDQIKFTAGEISSAVDDAKQNLENVAKDVLQDILKGNVRNNLQEQIERMLTETIETAIEEVAGDTLEERIQSEVNHHIQEAVTKLLPEIISVAVEKKVQEMTPVLPIEEISQAKETAEDTPKIEEENKEELFQELEPIIPEAVSEEEEPFFVQPVRKTAPKKKIPTKKSTPRILQPMNKQMEAEELADTGNEPSGNTNKEKILKLHKEGKSYIDIAKELGLGIGEVKLIIGLFEGI